MLLILCIVLVFSFCVWLFHFYPKPRFIRIFTSLLRKCKTVGDERLELIHQNKKLIIETANLLINREFAKMQNHPQVREFSKHLLGEHSYILSKEALLDAIKQRHPSPFSNTELDIFPSYLKAELLKLFLDQLQAIYKEQKIASAAHKAAALINDNRVGKARKVIVPHLNDETFVVEIFKKANHTDFLYKATQLTPEQLHDIEQQDTAQHNLDYQKIKNALDSLTFCNQLEWDAFLETVNPLHQQLSKDPTYPEMDFDSRRAYRAEVSVLSQHYQKSEEEVCKTLFKLTEGTSPSTIQSHIGYYLLDDGYGQLVLALTNHSILIRLRLWFAKHKLTFYRVSSWGLFFGFLALAFAAGYALWSLIPFAFLLTHTIQSSMLAHFTSKKQDVFPRIEIDRLSGDDAVLVIYHTKITTIENALHAVEQMQVMHEANPDEHIHFLLLGEFPDSLTATQATENDIVVKTAEAVNTLCQTTLHPYYYIQRQRTFVPGSRTYHSRERTHGGLESIVHLINNGECDEEFLYSSLNPSKLHNKYRYLFTLNDDTVLPADMIKHFAGGMLHPLHKAHSPSSSNNKIRILQPTLVIKASKSSSFLARHLKPFWPANQSIGLIDCKAYEENVLSKTPQGILLDHCIADNMIADIKVDHETPVTISYPITFSNLLIGIHHQTRALWQAFPLILPYWRFSLRHSSTPAQRYTFRISLLSTFKEYIILLLLFYAAFTNRLLLALILIVVALTPRKGILFSARMLHFAYLPCLACTRIHAQFQAVYRLLFARYRLQDWLPADDANKQTTAPPMLFFAINMTCAVISAFCGLINEVFSFQILLAVLWAFFPLLLPYTEQTHDSKQKVSQLQETKLLALASRIFSYFQQLINSNNFVLPPVRVEEGNKSAEEITTPSAIGMQLCALVAAEKMRLISASDMIQAIAATTDTLEKLTKMNGLFYSAYDSKSLSPITQTIDSVSCGLLAVCLLTAAQGIREVLNEVDPDYEYLPTKMATLCQNMALEMLFDDDKQLFAEYYSTKSDSHTHYIESRLNKSCLLSFISIMLRKVPYTHWYKLKKGSISRYLCNDTFDICLPFVFLPLTNIKRYRKLLTKLHAKQKLLLSQYFHRFAFTKQALYPIESFVLLPFSPDSACHSIAQMQQLQLDSSLGFYKAAFTDNLTGKTKWQIIHEYDTVHQGIMLCSICNALHDGYLTNLFAKLPRTQAFFFLFDDL